MASNGFGERIYKARMALVGRLGRPVTQSHVGEAMGVTQTTVGNWEAGDKEPNLETFERLARVLGTAEEYLAFDMLASVRSSLREVPFIDHGPKIIPLPIVATPSGRGSKKVPKSKFKSIPRDRKDREPLPDEPADEAKKQA